MFLMRTALVVLASVAATEGLMAQTITAFKTGERTTGQTKQCYYEALGSEYTRTIRAVQLCPLTIRVPAPTPKPDPSRTVTAFKTGERTTGQTKQCYYEALGSKYTRTIRAVQLCPLTIRVKIGGSR